ncbi:MAG: hypothetical protein IKH11_06455 [Bacteroidales bacterium]|nr:hypothetical protein [Bacteroidales bacterium]
MRRRSFSCRTISITSKSRGLPGTPIAFRDGVTARQIVFSVRVGSADEQLVVEMAKRGYKLARRTIAKYRDLLGIPHARWRKEI